MKRRRRRLLLGSFCVAAVAVVGLVALADGPPPPDAPEPTVVVAAPGERVRVEVLNVGGVTGMARDATVRLRDAGFDVVDFGNAPGAFDVERPSAVVDRVGRADLARAVADVLGIDNVLSDPDPNLYVDVSVLLGSDWTRRGPGSDDDGRGARAWWDLRTWLGR